jgi:hypothetical protein
MKLKSLLLTFALTLFAVSGLLAQDKYEYATVAIRGYNVAVIKATEVNTFPIPKGVDFDKEQIKKVEELNQEGWELFNTTTTAVGSYVSYQFYLRKKKN